MLQCSPGPAKKFRRYQEHSFTVIRLSPQVANPSRQLHARKLFLQLICHTAPNPLRHPVPFHHILRLCVIYRHLLNIRSGHPHSILVQLDQRCRIVLPAAFPSFTFPAFDSARIDCATGCDVKGWGLRIWGKKPAVVKAAKRAVARV